MKEYKNLCYLVVITLAFLLPVNALAQEILNYQTGFEEPTFVLGPLDGQDGWREGGCAEISDTHPQGGSQSIKISCKGVQAPSEYRLIIFWTSHDFNYDTIANGTPVIEVSVDVRLDGPDTGQGGADDALSANLVPRGGDVGYLGVPYLSSTGEIFFAGQTVPADLGQYHRMGMRIDFFTRITQFFVNGDLVLSWPLPSLITTNTFLYTELDLVFFNPDYPNLPPNLIIDPDLYTAYFDNLSVMAVAVDSTKARFTLFYRDHFASDRLRITGHLKPKLEEMPFDKDVTVVIKVPDPRDSTNILTVFEQTIPAGTVSGTKKYRFRSREPGIHSLRFDPRTDSTRLSLSVDDVDLLPEVRASCSENLEPENCYLELIRSIEYYVITVEIGINPEIDEKLWSGLSHLKPTARTNRKQELKLER